MGGQWEKKRSARASLSTKRMEDLIGDLPIQSSETLGGEDRLYSEARIGVVSHVYLGRRTRGRGVLRHSRNGGDNTQK